MDRRCISFPFNRMSEVVLYSMSDTPRGDKIAKLEVMPIGSTGSGTFCDLLKEYHNLLVVLFLVLLVIAYLPLLNRMKYM